MSALLRLTIDNIGLIAHAEVAFAEGFTAFTGETGSGKTMLLGALDVALGGRVEREMVRGERARVTLEIGAGDDVRALLAASGIELAADDDVVIVREIAAAGRSQARVNGVAVSAGQLREIGAQVVDTVGQGETYRLLEPGFARDAVDRFAGSAAVALRTRMAAAFADRRRQCDERDALRARGDAAAVEFARFALAEIDAAALNSDDEDERLRERRDVLGNAERIAAALAQARAALEDEAGAVDALGDAAHAIGGLVRFGGAFAELAEAAAAVQSDANELASKLARAAEDVDRDPHELEIVAGRLATVEALKKKYGGSIAAVRAARARFAAAVDADAGRDERLALLDRDVAVLDAAIASDASALHALRVDAARACEARIATELRALAMPAARFTIAVEALDAPAPHGADRVEFRFSANPGEAERPLAKVASGGERSRVLLAVIVALAAEHEPRAFVFDEIDAGIGGATATAVGARLRRLAAGAQVVAVTHLAQIASGADAHFALRKHDGEDGTTIDVVPLQAEADRLAEIARMLSGDASRISIEHAATLVAATRSGRRP